MSTTPNVYQPGVCNIGKAEIQQRRVTGIIGAVVTVVAVIAFVLLHVPDPWRLLVALPAGLGAAGFLQAGLHFCARFGMSGLFNFDATQTGKTEAVHEQEYRRKDQRKALLVLGLSGVAAVVAVVIAVLLP
ncbi:MAG: hypothetical protein ABJA94_09920 [Rhodoglobus sp.]